MIVEVVTECLDMRDDLDTSVLGKVSWEKDFSALVVIKHVRAKDIPNVMNPSSAVPVAGRPGIP